MAPALRPQESPPIIVCGASNLVRRPSTSPSSSYSPSSISSPPSTTSSPRLPPTPNPQDRLAAEAARLAPLVRAALATLTRLGGFNPSLPCTREDILRLPLRDPGLRPAEELSHLPRRKSRRMPLAAAVAALVFPAHVGSLAPLIRYEEARVRLRGWGVVAREFELMVGGMGRFGAAGGAAPRVELDVLNARVLAQGPWDAEMNPISLDGVRCEDVGTEVLASGDIAPLLQHLKSGGGAQPGAVPAGATALNDGTGEPHYGVRGLEFPRGILLGDGRLDLYKTGMGPHIEPLMRILRTNTFIRHVQLGSNALGRRGCTAVAAYLRECPGRIESWYLAANGIDAAGLGVLVDGLARSRAVTSLFLRGNPLGPDAVPGLLRLVTGSESLRVLDLDETRLGDGGVARLFGGLVEHVASGGVLSLEAIHLRGNGLAAGAAAAISRLLALQSHEAPHVHSLYLSYNPLGDVGALALSKALPSAHLRRLTLQSTGLGTRGATALAHSLHRHPTLRVLDLSQGASTVRLQQAFNYIDDGALPALRSLIDSTPLECLSLGHCALTPAALSHLAESVARSRTLLTYFAASIHNTRAQMYARPFVPAQGSAHCDLVTGVVLTREVGEAEAEAGRRVGANVEVRFGTGYAAWREAGARRVLVDGVRGVDSVYEGRDVKALARDISFLVK